MDISAKNVMLVLSVIAGVVLVLILVYFVPIIGGTIIGVTVTEVTGAGLNLSAGMDAFISATETGYITTATSALDKVSLAISIFAVVIILILFGFTDIFDRLKGWMFGSKGMGGSGSGPL